MVSAKIVHTSGKRKTAKARATFRKGKGVLRINHVPYEVIEPRYIRYKIEEPLILAGGMPADLDIDVNVKGGGINSQAEAAALAIAKGLVAWTEDEKLKKKYLEYNRALLVADPRRVETSKPNRSKARAKRQKSYR